MSDDTPGIRSAQEAHDDPDRPKRSEEGGRVQVRRGKRAVDALLAGAGQPMPAGFTPGPKEGTNWAKGNFRKEMPPIPEVLPDGTKIALSLKQRTVLAMVLGGYTTTQIAEAVGMTQQAVRALVAGRNTPHVRETFRMLLESSGIDAVAMIAKTHELLNATRAQWNPDTKQWDHFPDYGVQLGTWRPLVQLLGFMPARAQAAQGSGPVVNLFTNVGAGAKASAPETKDQGRTLRIEIGRQRLGSGESADDGEVIDVEAKE